MELGKLPVPGRPTTLDTSRTRAHCACDGCGLWVVCTFFSVIYHYSVLLPLSERRPDID